MSRDDGFRVADTDTGMMADPKVLALARRFRDPIKTMAAVGLYDAVRLASWGAGRRLMLEETVPGWWLEPVDEIAAHLVAVGLLDAERRIPAHAWEGWFVPALDRFLANRRGSIYAGLVSRGMAPAAANQEADRRIAERRSNLLGSTSKAEPIGSTSDRTVPTEPTEPTEPTGGSRARDEASTPESPSESRPVDDDPHADPETPVLVWLAQHGCYIRPGNGYHQQVVTAVERHGAEALGEALERLSAAGYRDGDVKGLLFGAIDALDKAKRPDMKVVEKNERDDAEERAHRARLERTRRDIDEYKSWVGREPTEATP